MIITICNYNYNYNYIYYATLSLLLLLLSFVVATLPFIFHQSAI